MTTEGKTQVAIVKAALKLIAKYGLEKTSMDMIAAEAGVTKPAIYYYFSSKENLIDYLFSYVTADYSFDFYFQIQAYNEDNFQARLVADGIRFFGQYKNDSPELRVVNEFLLNASLKSKYESRLNAMMKGFLEGFQSLLAHGAELRVVSSENIRSNAYILALLIDNISNYLMMGINADYEDIWQTAVSHMMKETS